LYVGGLYRRKRTAEAASDTSSADTPACEANENVYEIWKGKSLYASKNVYRGDSVFVERKHLGVVEGESFKLIKTCEFCMRCLGNIEQQIYAISQPKKSSNHYTLEKIYRKYEESGQEGDANGELPYKDQFLYYTKLKS